MALIDSYTIDDGNSVTLGFSTYDFGQGQSFTTTAAYSLEAVEFNLFKTGLPTDNVYIEVSDSLNGSVLATSNNVNGNDIPSVKAYVQFIFSSPLNLANATTYFLRVRRSGGQNASLYYNLEGDGNVGYTGGDDLAYDNVTWTIFAGIDLNFKTYGTISTTTSTSSTSTSSTSSSSSSSSTSSTSSSTSSTSSSTSSTSSSSSSSSSTSSTSSSSSSSTSSTSSSSSTSSTSSSSSSSSSTSSTSSSSSTSSTSSSSSSSSTSSTSSSSSSTSSTSSSTIMYEPSLDITQDAKPEGGYSKYI